MKAERAMARRTERARKKIAAIDGMPAPGEGRVNLVVFRVEVDRLDAKKRMQDRVFKEAIVAASSFDKTVRELLLEQGIDPTHLE